MLTLTQKDKFVYLANSFMKIAGLQNEYVTVSYGLKGHSAGDTYGHDRNIRLNEELALRYFSEFDETVAHECAHIIDYIRSGEKWRTNSRNGNITVHDATFYAIMNELGFPNAKRTHAFKTKPSRVYRKFAYKCDCAANQVVKTPSHNKMQNKGARYICNKCNTEFGKESFIKEIVNVAKAA